MSFMKNTKDAMLSSTNEYKIIHESTKKQKIFIYVTVKVAGYYLSGNALYVRFILHFSLIQLLFYFFPFGSGLSNP